MKTIKEFLQLIKEANLPNTLDWGVIHDGKVINRLENEPLHYYIWKRLGVPTKTTFRIEWIFEDFDRTLYIRLVLPDKMYVSDISEKVPDLDKNYHAIIELLNMIPYEKLILEISTDRGNTHTEYKAPALLQYLREIFFSK